MTLNQLELFVALADAQGFTAAGARLGLSQSAVSHTIRALEKSLMMELFDRRDVPPRLTPGALRLLPEARGLLAHAETIRQQAQAQKALKSGLLRIGSFGPSASVRLLPQLLQAFAKRYPGVEVRVVEDADPVIDQWLVDRRVELGFVTLPDDRFETIQVAQDEYVVLAPEQHPFAKQKRVRAAQLDGQAFIASSAGCADEIDALLRRARARPHELFRLPQVFSVLGLVQQGLGIAVSVRLALPDAWPGVVYRSFEPAARRRLGLAMVDRSKLSPAAAAFIELAQEMRTQVRIES